MNRASKVGAGTGSAKQPGPADRAIDVAFYVAAVMALLQAERMVAQELVQVTSRLDPAS